MAGGAARAGLGRVDELPDGLHPALLDRRPQLALGDLQAPADDPILICPLHAVRIIARLRMRRDLKRAFRRGAEQHGLPRRRRQPAAACVVRGVHLRGARAGSALLDGLTVDVSAIFDSAGAMERAGG